MTAPRRHGRPSRAGRSAGGRDGARRTNRRTTGWRPSTKCRPRRAGRSPQGSRGLAATDPEGRGDRSCRSLRGCGGGRMRLRPRLRASEAEPSGGRSASLSLVGRDTPDAAGAAKTDQERAADIPLGQCVRHWDAAAKIKSVFAPQDKLINMRCACATQIGLSPHPLVGHGRRRSDAAAGGCSFTGCDRPRKRGGGAESLSRGASEQMLPRATTSAPDRPEGREAVVRRRHAVPSYA